MCSICDTLFFATVSVGSKRGMCNPTHVSLSWLENSGNTTRGGTLKPSKDFEFGAKIGAYAGQIVILIRNLGFLIGNCRRVQVSNPRKRVTAKQVP